MKRGTGDISMWSGLSQFTQALKEQASSAVKDAGFDERLVRPNLWWSTRARLCFLSSSQESLTLRILILAGSAEGLEVAPVSEMRDGAWLCVLTPVRSWALCP